MAETNKRKSLDEIFGTTTNTNDLPQGSIVRQKRSLDDIFGTKPSDVAEQRIEIGSATAEPTSDTLQIEGTVTPLSEKETPNAKSESLPPQILEAGRTWLSPLQPQADENNEVWELPFMRDLREKMPAYLNNLSLSPEERQAYKDNLRLAAEKWGALATARDSVIKDVVAATNRSYDAAQDAAHAEAASQAIRDSSAAGIAATAFRDDYGDIYQTFKDLGNINKKRSAAVIINNISLPQEKIGRYVDAKVAVNADFRAKTKQLEADINNLVGPGNDKSVSLQDAETILSELSPEEREAAEQQIAELTAAVENLQQQYIKDVEAIYKQENLNVGAELNALIYETLAGKAVATNSLQYVLQAAWDNSLIGMLHNAATGRIASAEDMMVAERARQLYNPNGVERVVSGAGAILVDTIPFAILGAVGSGGAQLVREGATRIVAGQIARKVGVSGANNVVKGTARRIVERSVLQQFAEAATAQAITLGGYNGLLTTAQETLSPTGENGEFNWRNVFHRMGEGAVTGVFLGGVSTATSAAKGAMYRARPDMAYTATGMAADLGISLTGFTAENAAFLGVGSLFSGEEITAEAIGESVATLGLLKGIGVLKRKVKGEELMQQPDFVQRTISDLKFKKEEMDAMRNAGIDMEQIDIISKVVMRIAEPVYANTQDAISRKSMMKMYNSVMDPRNNIPLSAKTKLHYIVRGELPGIVGPVRAEVGENGEVRFFDYQDRLVEIRTFENTEAASKFVTRMTPLFEKNIIADGEKALLGADNLLAIHRAVDAYMKSSVYLESLESGQSPSKGELLSEMLIVKGVQKGTIPESSRARIETIQGLARNEKESLDTVFELQLQVAKQHGTTVSELNHALNVKPDLRTVRESQLVKSYVDGLKQFYKLMSGPIEAEQARYNAQMRPQIEQGKQEIADAQRETEFVRNSLNEAAKRMATADGKQIAIVRLENGEQVAVHTGRIVLRENGTIDHNASEQTIVIKRIDAEGNEKRESVGIDDIAEVIEQGTPEEAVEASMSVLEAQATKKLSLDKALSENGELGVEVVAIDGTRGKIVGIDENGAYILRVKGESGKEVDVLVSINDIEAINAEQPATTEQAAVADAVEKVVENAATVPVEVVYDDDFPPLTDADMAPQLDADKIQWEKLSPEDYTSASAMLYGDATTLADSHIYHTNSRAKLAKAKQSVAEQQKVIDKLNSRFATLSSPAEAQKLRKQVAAAEQEKAKREQAVKNIEEQMAKYAHAMRKYGVEVATEDSLLAERTRLEEERNVLLEADKELDRYEQQEATKGKKAIANTAANRKYIEQLYADRFGVSPAQAGPRQAILWDLANGAIKLRWDNVTTDSGAVQRGLQAELGVRGTEERRAYKAVIDNKNGQSVDAYVHDLWQSGEWGQEISTEELKDELLGVLQSTPNGSLALKELADMSGAQADLEAQISLGKGDIQRKLEEVDANLAKNAQQMADFRKRINDTVQKLENGEPIESVNSVEKNAASSERNNANSHNSSSGSLLQEGNAQLSGESLTPLKDATKISKKEDIPFMIEQKPTEQAVSEAEQNFNRDVFDAFAGHLGETLGAESVVTDAAEAQRVLEWHQAVGERLRTAVSENAEIAAERAEIERVAKENGTWLKAPNGDDTNLTERQWVDVRTSRFKSWFGDMGKAFRVAKLRDSKSVTIPNNINEGKYELTQESAENYILQNMRKGYRINDTGETVFIHRKGAQKVTSHSVDNEAHLKSIAAIPEMLEKAIFIEEVPADPNKPKPKYDLYRYYICGLRIGKEDYTVRLTIGVKQGKHYYDHSLTEIEKGNLIEIANGFIPQGGRTIPANAEGKDTKLIPLLQINSSNIIDANGEPKVVYHGTPNQFNAFNRELIGSSTDRGIWGRGFYFTSNKAEAERYTKRGDATGEVKEVFLNIRKPLAIKAEQGDAGKEYIQSLYRKHVTDEIFEDPRTTDAKLAEATQKVTDELVENGYDGVVVTYKDGTQEYVVFNPNQIKSATENTGEYNPANDDIRMFIEAYHGSGADFEKFDHSFMSTGEGAQAFGWGTYVTEVENIAKRYARASGESARRAFEKNIEKMLSLYRKDIADNRIMMESSEKTLSELKEAYGRVENELQQATTSKARASKRQHLAELHNDIESYQALIDRAREQIQRLSFYENKYAKEWEKISAAKKIAQIEQMLIWDKQSVDQRKEMISQWQRELKGLDYTSERYKSKLRDIEGFEEVVERSEREIRAKSAELAELKAIEQPKFQNLYSVEVPDNRGDNYLSWTDELPKTHAKRINNALAQRTDLTEEFVEADRDMMFKRDGRLAYMRLEQLLGSDKAASEFLQSLGFTGIEYPAQYLSGGRADGAKNYVIFNADDVKIVDHVQYFKTPNGEVYGFVYEDKIYLDPTNIDPKAPVHEYTELWCREVAKANEELWKRGKELVKQTKVWEEVNADENYKNQSEDLRASEAWSRIIADEMMGKAREYGSKGLMAKLRGWLRSFWKTVKSVVEKWTKKELKDLTVEQFKKMTMADFINKVDPRKWNAKKPKEVSKSHKQAQLDIIKKHNPMQDDVHTGIRKVEDIKSFDEVLGESRKNQAEYGELTYPDMNIDMMESAAESGMITVYSSYPIKQGVFVTPSYMNAQDYAGGSGRVYQATVPVDDVAWIAEDEGQYARVETEPMRPMIVGEKGAANLDAMEEATTRLDNLAVAREMEEANRDAKAIKLATGWERGADDKWRYEIDDRPVREEAVNRLTNQLEYQQNSSVMLYDLLSGADELFAAYPDLMKLRVVVDGKSDSVIPAGRLEWADDIYDSQIVLNRAAVQSHFAQDELEGYGRADRALIKIRQGINPKTQEKFSSEAEQAEYLDLYTGIAEEYLAKYKKSKAMRLATTARVVSHEIQHAIQFIEGFARGSSVEEFDDKRGTLISDIDFATDGDFLKGSSISNAQSVHEALNKKVPYTEMTVKEAYADKLQRVASKYGYENIEALADDFTKFPSAFEQYHRTAGEVEARNVQKRILEGLTPEERRATLLSETEDVAREDQIFLENNLGVAQSVEVSEPVEAPTRKPRKSAAEKSLEKIAELREQLKNKKRSLNDTLLDVYNFLVSKDIAETMGEGVGKAQYRRVIKNSIEAIRKAYDVTDVEEKRKTIFKYLGEIDDSLSQLLTRQRLNEVTDILDKAIYGYTAQGVRTGKRIDEHTREIFDILRNAIGEPVEEERDDSGRRKPVHYRLKNRTETGDITSSFRLRSVGNNEGIIAKLRSEADDIIASADVLDSASVSKSAQLEYTANLLSLYDNALQLNEAIGQTTDEIADIQREIDRTNEQYKAAATGSEEKKNLYKMRQKLQNDLEAEQMNRAALRHRYASILKTFTTSLEELDEKGAGDFARAEMAKAEQAVKWRRGIYNSIKNPNAPVLPVEDYNRQGKEVKVNWKGLNTRAKINESVFMATFAEMSRDIDINSIPGQWAKDGWYYQFMLAPGGYMERTDWRYKTEKALREELDAEMLKLSGDKKADDPYKLFAALAQEPSGLVIPRLSVSKNKDGKTVGGYQDNIPLTIGQILYMRNAIRQPNGYAGYLAWGIPEEDMKKITQYAEANYPKYCRFADWVVTEFMPKLYEMQDAIYFEKFGTHLPKTAFYFPFVRDKRLVGKIAEVGEGEVSLPSSVTGNIVERVKTSAKMDLQADMFKVLQDHIKETLDWCAYVELTDKFNSVATSHTFGNILKAQGVSVRKLREMYELAVGQGKINSTENTTLTKVLNAASKGLVAGNIVLNLNSAAKQLVSGSCALGYTANPKIVPIWAKNFFVPSAIKTSIGKLIPLIKSGEADPAQIINWKAFADNWKWAVENIPTLRERWEGRNAGFEVLKAHSFDSWDKLSSIITTFGLAPNAMIDMFTCCNVAKTVYEYEYPRLLERGRSKDEAHREACVKAAIFTNETQQSGIDAFLSSFQSGGGLQRLLGVGLGAYQNTAMAFARNERFAITNMLRMINPNTRQQMITRQASAYRDMGIEDKKARELAKADYNESHGAQFSAFVHNGVVSNLLWTVAGTVLTTAISAGIAALFGGKEEWEKAMNNEKFRDELSSALSVETIAWQTPLLYNTPIFKQLLTYMHNASQGKTYGGIFESPSSQAAQEMIDAVFKQWVGVKNEVTGEIETQEPTRYDRSAEWLVFSTLVKAGLGINPDLVVRMAEGVDGMMKDGVQVEDVMDVLSSPRGLTRAIAGEPRKGESKQQYLDRLSYIYRQVNAGSGKYDQRFVSERTKEYIEQKDNELYREMGIEPRQVRILEQRVKGIQKNLTNIKSREGREAAKSMSSEQKSREGKTRGLSSAINKLENVLKQENLEGQFILPFDEEGVEERKKRLKRKYELLKEVMEMWKDNNSK